MLLNKLSSERNLLVSGLFLLLLDSLQGAGVHFMLPTKPTHYFSAKQNT